MANHQQHHLSVVQPTDNCSSATYTPVYYSSATYNMNSPPSATYTPVMCGSRRACPLSAALSGVSVAVCGDATVAQLAVV